MVSPHRTFCLALTSSVFTETIGSNLSGNHSTRDVFFKKKEGKYTALIVIILLISYAPSSLKVHSPLPGGGSPGHRLRYNDQDH